MDRCCQPFTRPFLLFEIHAEMSQNMTITTHGTYIKWGYKKEQDISIRYLHGHVPY